MRGDIKMFYTTITNIKISEMPFYHRTGAKNGNTYIRLGNYVPGGNEPYCFAQEKQCANHICRVLAPEKTVLNALVIRDDGTVWKIYLKQFRTVELLNIQED